MNRINYENQKNKEFESYLTDHDFDAFKNIFFDIWNGNYHFKVWYNIKEMKMGRVEYHICLAS